MSTAKQPSKIWSLQWDSSPTGTGFCEQCQHVAQSRLLILINTSDFLCYFICYILLHDSFWSQLAETRPLSGREMVVTLRTMGLVQNRHSWQMPEATDPTWMPGRLPARVIISPKSLLPYHYQVQYVCMQNCRQPGT